MFIESGQIKNQDNPKIGGKARNLLKLESLRMNVPPWLVIPSDVLESTPIDTINQALKSHQLIIGNTDARFAVRSSAIDEDSEEASFAGQFETFLNVTSQNLLSAIKEVKNSAKSDRVKQYRKNKGLPENQEIAVVVQKMIDAEISGVAFGADPVTGDMDSKIISAVYGVGEGLVSGELNSDNYKIINGDINKTIVKKEHAFVVNSNRDGISKVSVSEKLVSASAMRDNQVKEVVYILEVLGAKLEKPQDVEFAYNKDELFLLQTRPITTLRKKIKTDQFIIWDNSNIIESYPGVTTPLTFSFIIKMYDAVYRQFSLLMGVSSKEVDSNKDVFSNMLGLIQGRVYYNLLSWYRALALLPGYSLNASFMEKMMGVKERFELKKQKSVSKTIALLRFGTAIVKILYNLISLPRQRVKFLEVVDATIRRYQKMNFDSLPPEVVISHYKEFENVLLTKWKAPLVNDFFAMIYFGILEKLTKKWVKSQNQNLHNDLLCGSNDIISTEPVKRILEISASVQENNEAKEYFIANSREDIWEIIKGKKFSDISEKIHEYLTLFGDRCVGELKLETFSYNQQPEVFVGIIKSYVEQGIIVSKGATGVEKKLREEAGQKVNKAFKWNIPKKFLFKYVLRVTRTLVSARENLRYERTRAFGMVRVMFASIGRQFHKAGVINNDRDIFYLTQEEIFDFIKGTAVTANLKRLIDIRKEEFEKYKQMSPPSERISTHGIVYVENDFNSIAETLTLNGDIKGIGCCPGRIRGKVRVVNSPDECNSLNGDILVTSSTDPGWVTLFPTASAILVERGSMLSHSAIVSRELGIPCIVGITGLLKVLKTGDELEMDGATGELKLLTDD
ncbi:MAG: phosphoenolpyruvate synthase [Flavobacteriales bacterium]|nr:phosphoenolpyruvate synthase [Flavobacteriales bacterium]|tara:strand:+ start:4243 stop:6789 length:2547 start_codon:yes stop_codon:yes gene_type:complete